MLSKYKQMQTRVRVKYKRIWMHYNKHCLLKQLKSKGQCSHQVSLTFHYLFHYSAYSFPFSSIVHLLLILSIASFVVHLDQCCTCIKVSTIVEGQGINRYIGIHSVTIFNYLLLLVPTLIFAHTSLQVPTYLKYACEYFTKNSRPTLAIYQNSYFFPLQVSCVIEKN